MAKGYKELLGLMEVTKMLMWNHCEPKLTRLHVVLILLKIGARQFMIRASLRF